MTTTRYTLTRRHDNHVLHTGIDGYMTALGLTERYPNVDVIIHPDGTDWMEEKRRQAGEYDITQGGWAWL